MSFLRLAAEAEALIQPCLEQDEKHVAALLMLAFAGLHDRSNTATSAGYARAGVDHPRGA